MLKNIITDLAWWIYQLADCLFPSEEPDEVSGTEEEWAKWNEEVDESMYLSEILCREVMAITK